MILKKIGSVNKCPLYKIIIQPNKIYHKTICISAGIHGDEISGPLGVQKFLLHVNKKSVGNNRIIILPVGNPYGFNHNIRTNRNYINLNRHFTDKKLKDECKILLAAIQHESLDCFCAFHEDDEQKTFYMYAMNKLSSDSKLHENIKTAAQKYTKIFSGKTLYKQPVKKGVIFDIKDGSFEHRMSKEGAPESLCVEIPDYLPLQTRVALVEAIMKKIVWHYKNNT